MSVAALLLASSGLGSVVLRANAIPGSAVTSLQQQIDAILANQGLSGAQVGVLVRSATDGSTLYAHNPTSLLVPASNDKLYTSNTALQVLGPDYRFTTTVAASNSPSNGIVNGNLYLKGTGDPTMQAADYDSLAASVAAKGIHRITGQLVANDSSFDHRQLGYDWAWDSNPYYYQPEISALTVAADQDFDISSLTIETTPSTTVGKPAQVKTLPATNYVTIKNQTTTGPAGSANSIAVERELGLNTIDVTGSIALGDSPDDEISTVTDPTGYAAATFRDALARHGVAVLGNTTRSAMPSTAKMIAARQSMPLSQLLTPFLKLSNNGIAETLIKAMGAHAQTQGSWDNGLATELPILSGNFGVDTNSVQLFDGSGLSAADLVTPQQTTNLLLAARHASSFQTWYNALPIAGESDPLIGGTLRSRMVGTKAAGNVHAKTGTLDNVSALSGYVTTADSKPLVFSIMETGYNENQFYPKPIEDQIAVALANYNTTTGAQITASDLRAQTTPTSKAALQDKKSATQGLECSWTESGC